MLTSKLYIQGTLQMTLKSFLRFKSLDFNPRPAATVLYGLREFTGFLSSLFHPFLCKIVKWSLSFFFGKY